MSSFKKFHLFCNKAIPGNGTLKNVDMEGTELDRQVKALYSYTKRALGNDHGLNKQPHCFSPNNTNGVT